MTKTRMWVHAIALGLLAGQADAATVSVSNGVWAGSFVRDCRSSSALSGPDRCIEGNRPSFPPFVESVEASYPGALQAGVLTSHPLARTSGIDVTGSMVEASSNPLETPRVRLAVFTSTNYARASTGVASLQGYTWDGTGDPARSLSLTATFTGSNLIDTDPTPDFIPEAIMYGSIMVFSLTTPTFEVEDALPVGDPIPGACYLDAQLPDCLASRADYRLEAVDYYGGSDTTATAAFTLESGRTYFVWVEGSGIARFGAYVDARNTVLTRWSDATGLTAATGQIVPIEAVVDWLADLLQQVSGVGYGRLLEWTVARANSFYSISEIRATCVAMSYFQAEVRGLARLSELIRHPAPWKISKERAKQLLDQSRAITTAIGCT